MRTSQSRPARLRRLSALGGLALLAVMALPALAASATSTTSSDEATVAEALPAIMHRYDTTGAAVVLLRGGKIESVRSFGLANVSSKSPVTGSTRFLAGSMSKAVTAWGVMHLVEQGRLSLDEPVSLSGYAFGSRTPPTVRQLLSHTGGVTVDGYSGVRATTQPPSLLQTIDGHAGDPPVRQRWHAGSRFRYSSGGYALLQLLIEQTTNTPFAEYMRDEILTPLGMTSSSFVADAATATGYRRGALLARRRVYPAQAAEGLYTTPDDLGRFLSASFDNEIARAGRGVVKPETVALMMAGAPRTRGADPLMQVSSYGFGYFIEELTNGEQVAWHPGVAEGYAGMFALDPARGSGIAVLTNADSGVYAAADMLHVWAERLLGATFGYHRATERLGWTVTAISLAIAAGWALFVAARLTAVALRRATLLLRQRRWRRVIIPVTIGVGWWLLGSTPLIPGLIWHEDIAPTALAPPLFKTATLLALILSLAAAAVAAITHKPHAPHEHRVRMSVVRAIGVATGIVGWIVLWRTDAFSRFALSTPNIVPGNELPGPLGWVMVMLPIIALAAAFSYKRARRPSIMQSRSRPVEAG